MKTKYALVLVLSISNIGLGKAQNNPEYKPQNGDTNMVIDFGSIQNVQPLKADINPEYIYGDSLFMNYVDSKINKSIPCIKKKEKLSVRLRFVVDLKGNAIKLAVIDSCKVCQEFEKEICRIITEAPIWRPAMAGGHFVTGYKTMVIQYPFDNPNSSKTKINKTSNSGAKTDSSSLLTLKNLEINTGPIIAPDKNAAPDEKAEIAPRFVGRDSAFNQFVKTNFKYPAACMEAGISGDLLIRMVVNTAGKLSNIQVIKSVANCPDFDAEAIRLLQSGPMWIPGITKGKFVKCYHTITMHIGLD